MSLAQATNNLTSSQEQIVIRAAGPEADGIVAKHWRKMWLEAGMKDADLLPDLAQRTQSFIDEARLSLNYQTFLAMNEAGQVVGSASCQSWSGPIPLVVKPTSFKLGTVWAVYVKPAYRLRGIAAQLMESVKAHWCAIGCLRGVLLHATSAGRAVYEKVGFTEGNMLLLDMSLPCPKHQSLVSLRDNAGSLRVEAAGPEADDVVVKHWRLMWLEAGIPESELEANLEQITTTFIKQARATLQYQTFVARDGFGEIVGSASCQQWSGPLPCVLDEAAFKMGTVWAVFVKPDYRCCGLATKLMEHCIQHWKAIGCQKGVLIYASDKGRRVYERLGFKPANGMVIDLPRCHEKWTEDIYIKPLLMDRASCISHGAAEPDQKGTLEPCQRKVGPVQTSFPPSTLDLEIPTGFGVSLSPNPASPLHRAAFELTPEEAHMVSDLKKAGVVGNREWLCLLLRALQPQLEAAFGHDVGGRALVEQVVSVQRAHNVYIDPTNNWFTHNLHKFGGGFDMQKLTEQPGLLAQKFDRLSNKYDQWTVGNRSRVHDWVTRQARKHAPQLGVDKAHILDAACGIGLPAHQLRLCGYKGYIVGTDISPGMIEQARQRGAHDSLVVANANEGLPIDTCCMDLVVCSGAMELLDHDIVLSEFARVLRAGGQLWVSFQLEDPSAIAQHPTAHQNVYGITHPELVNELTTAGFQVQEVEQCDNAFYTPSPAKDGSLLPVPYMFVTAQKP